MIHWTQLQVHGVPSVRVAPRLTMIVMTWDAYIQETWGLGGRKHREQHGDGAPIGEEMALIVVCPGVLTEREVALQPCRE